MDEVLRSIERKPICVLRQPELPESYSGRNKSCSKRVKFQLIPDESTRIAKWEASNKGW